MNVAETDAGTNIVVVKETEENWADFRVPLGLVGERVEGIVPLMVFMEAGGEAEGGKLLVAVKWVSPSLIFILD